MNKNKSPAFPYITAGVVWAAYAIIFPFYKITHVVIAAVLALIAWFIARRFVAEAEPVPEPEPSITRIQEQAAVLDSQADELKKAAEGIRDPEVSSYAASIESTIRKMSDNIEANPADAKKVREFTRHYIPTVISVFSKYRTMEQQDLSDVAGGNISGAMQTIEDSLKHMDEAFKRQLDKMFDDDALDIKTDIDVLTGLMEGNGMRMETIEKEDLSEVAGEPVLKL